LLQGTSLLRNTERVGIDKVAVGEMLSCYGFNSPRLCNTSNKDPEDFHNEFAKGYRERASDEFWGGPGLSSRTKRKRTRCTHDLKNIR
jgi:hypothetical protein